jgi:hypothetical protein
MSIDLTKLPAAPWVSLFDVRTGSHLVTAHGRLVLLPEHDDAEGKAIVEFAALARNALDVQMRRGWYAYRREPDGPFFVAMKFRHLAPGEKSWDAYFALQEYKPDGWPDPDSALVEADRWMTEQEAAGR